MEVTEDIKFIKMGTQKEENEPLKAEYVITRYYETIESNPAQSTRHVTDSGPNSGCTRKYGAETVDFKPG